MKKVLNIFGDITATPQYKTDISADMVQDQIEGLTANDEIEININSYGGEVFEAVAMANIIASSPAKKSFNILGVCASSATMLFSATDKVNISNGAMSMFHKPEVSGSGTAEDLRSRAVLLDKIESENIIKNLVARTKKPIDEITSLIANEWWLTYDESISLLGFLPLQKQAVFNKSQTRQIEVYNKYRKKALSNNAYLIFINHKNSLKR